MSPFSGLKAIAAVLGHRNYRFYAIGNATSLIGTWMQRLGVGWLTWELTGSGVWLGIIAFSDLFPTVVMAPVAGTLADGRDRLRIVRTTQTVAMIHALLLFGASATGLINIWLLFALTLFLGTVSAFDQPARLALVPSLVPREDVRVAVAFNSIVFNLARFVGPAAAGALIYWMDGPSLVFAVNAASFVVFIVLLWRLGPLPAGAAARSTERFLTRMASGVLYLARDPGLRVTLVLMIVVSVGGRPVVELLPGFAADVFHTNSNGLALLTASIGVGAIVGGLWIDAEASADALYGMLLQSAVILALAAIAFVGTAWLPLAAAALLVAGFGMARASIAAQTTIQLAVEPHMRGRVLSIYGMVFRGGPALGALLMGFASAQFGLRWPVFAGALLLLAGWVWAYMQKKTTAT